MSGLKRQQSKGSGRLNAEEYRELFEECHEAMAIIARDGTILDANHAASELFDWPHAEFLGMNILSVYANPEDRARYQEQIERDGYVRDFEVVFVTRGGRRLDCLLTTVVRRAADGRVIGYQGLVRDDTERRRMDRELREYHQQVRAMAAGFVAIEDRERRRIAVDLHDRVGQTLAASQMKIDVLRQADGEARQALLEDLHGLLDRTKRELRTLVFELSPPVLHDFGLVAGLRSLAGHLEEEHGLRVSLESQGDCEVADEDLRATLFRCLRELLLNVVRHAGTDAAAVSLRRDERQLSLAVADRGRGFEPTPDGARQGLGFGLFSIRECLSQAGGSFAIESAPGQGTRCVLAVPSSSLEPKENSR